MSRGPHGNPYRLVRAVCWLAVFTSVIVFRCAAVPAETTADAAPSDMGLSWIGIDGRYRPGHWTAIRPQPFTASDRVDVPSSSKEMSSSTEDGEQAPWLLQTTDGDGMPVVYRQPRRLADGEAEAGECGYVIPGSEGAPLFIRQGDRLLVRTRFPEFGPPADGPAAVPEGMSWILVFGRPLGVETIGANELLDRKASVAVTTVDAAVMLPDRSVGLTGVDQVMITPSGREVLRALTPLQQRALTDWVFSGGQVLLSLGPDAASMLEELDWLADWLPEEVAGAGTVRLDPAGLETFTSSQTRLDAFESIQLPLTGRAGSTGRALIAGRTTRRVQAVLAARYPVGLGNVTVVAADLEADQFEQWPERLDLIRRIGGKHFRGERTEIGNKVRISGYSDLAGQTRRMLDQFDVKRTFSFAFIAVVIVGWIGLVAPLDYLFVRHIVGRPLLGWLTFPVIAVVISVVFVAAASPRPTEPSIAAEAASKGPDDSLLRTNSIEFLDLDLTRGFGRLFRWNYLYSHPATAVDVTLSTSPELQAISSQWDHQLVYPFGYPGQSMGGIQMDSMGDRYGVRLSTGEPSAATAPLVSQIASLDLLPRSSKSLGVSMQFQTELPVQSIEQRKGAELLQGRLTNPLEVDLLDGMLIYRNWVYLLPTRFPAGASVAELDSLRQKNFRWQLSRQRALESASEAESWDVTRTDRPERIAEMLMFHEAVGGANYTSLRHEWLGDLDLSDVLGAERCILVGRTDRPWTELEVQNQVGLDFGDMSAGGRSDADAGPDDAGESAATPGWQHAWVRVIMPVSTSQRY